MIIGLTGLIGSGKTTVANIFAELGVKIIDTDLISHRLTGVNGKAISAIEDSFGSEAVVNGILNRGKLREIIFNSNEKHRLLEGILHPLIYDEVLLEVDTSNYVYNILAVPLLFRSPKYMALTVANIFVDCPYDLLLERLKVRSGLDREQVDAILAKQVMRETQLCMADDVIINDGNLSTLQSQVVLLHEKYIKKNNDKI